MKDKGDDAAVAIGYIGLELTACLVKNGHNGHPGPSLQ
jgi:hypothetical protein